MPPGPLTVRKLYLKSAVPLSSSLSLSPLAWLNGLTLFLARKARRIWSEGMITSRCLPVLDLSPALAFGWFGVWLWEELEIDFRVGVQKWMNECFEGIFEMWIQWAMAHSLSSPLESREEDKAFSKPMVGFCSVV